MDNQLLEVLACPLCKGKLHYDKNGNELWCRGDKLSYPIRQGIPVMLKDEARSLTLKELEKKS